MNRNIIVSILILVILFVPSCTTTQEKKEPVSIQTNASLEAMSLDDLIVDSELIVIGEATSTLPSMWMRQNEKPAQEATVEEIIESEGLFTDSIIIVNQVIKGIQEESTVRVRTFTGETNVVRSSASIEPEYVVGHTYLLFLSKDTGSTNMIEPGDYVATGAIQGVYEIVDGKAISIGWTGDWNIDDLISKIQKTLRGDTRVFMNLDDPLEGGEKVPLEDAPAIVNVTIQLPEGLAVRETWVSPKTYGVYGRFVAIRFEGDLLLIAHRLIRPPDWDGMIANFPGFAKITINGNEGMGASYGLVGIDTAEYPHPGSVSWWAEGVDYSLYSNTLSLEELLKIAETVH